MTILEAPLNVLYGGLFEMTFCTQTCQRRGLINLLTAYQCDEWHVARRSLHEAQDACTRSPAAVLFLPVDAK